MDGYINKQNVGPQKIQLTISTEKTTECALLSVRILSARSINGTSTFDVNPRLLSDDSVHFLMGYGIPMTSVWFQQESAKHHISNDVLHFFYDVFKETALLNILHYLRKDFHGHQSH